MSKNWCECREYLIGTLHKCKFSSQTTGVHCDKTPRCVFVYGHGGDCRIPQPGDGDLSDEIRMRVLRDRAATEYQRGYRAGVEAAAVVAHKAALWAAERGESKVRGDDPRYGHKATTAVEIERQIRALVPTVEEQPQ